MVTQKKSPSTPLIPSAADGRVIELTPFRAEITRALARRGKKLLESNDLAAQMSQLAPLEAYYTIKELGIEDALPLLSHASAEQFQACIDLDCWSHDDLRIAEIDAWLAPFAAAGLESLANAFFGLDEDVQVIFLARTVTVYDVRSEDAPPVPDAAADKGFMNTPDQLFTCTLNQVGASSLGESCDDAGTEDRWELEVEPFVLIKALYEVQPEEAMRLLMASKWELESSLLEQAFTFRNARLADLGFCDRSEAMRMFAPPPQVAPKTDGPALRPSPLPALYAAALHAQSIFVTVMGRLTDPFDLERLEGELICLVNNLVVASGEGPRNMNRVIEMAGQVRDTLSLGLLSLQSCDSSAACDLHQATADLMKWPLLNVFQWGHKQTLVLRRAAQALAAKPAMATFLAQTSDSDTAAAADRAFVEHLRRTPPLHAGFVPLRPEQTQAFTSPQHIRQVLDRLQALDTELCP